MDSLSDLFNQLSFSETVLDAIPSEAVFLPEDCPPIRFTLAVLCDSCEPFI